MMSKLHTMPLKFRVWDKESKRFCVPEQCDTRKWLWIEELSDLWVSDMYITDYEISQDTGMVDRNKNPIFTGDLVKCWDEHIGQVYYDKPLLQVRVKFNDGDDEDLASCEPLIMGNIWEHQELLEGK